MPDLSYRQILIDGRLVGLVGLDEVMAELAAEGCEPDPALGRLLVEGVVRHNYVAPAARPIYEQVLVEEYGRYWERRGREEQGCGRARNRGPATWRGLPREAVPWYPTIDRERCDDCGDCLRFCEFGVFEEVEATGQVVVREPFNCVVGCSGCVPVCTRRAIRFPPREILSQLGT